jgi:hypothetical protein
MLELINETTIKGERIKSNEMKNGYISKDNKLDNAN